ncbi:hypothetical protein ACHHYP_14907 [Achlya hypogyna]|uniref:UDENN domain-containing protein n=1 Tax=Achlya hypogyna TaxID=1202772 RepID=A0A1V9YC56_ACHHY|nr:hypothetical protein ACHHYP_14907 [Achlya hypogyna]
MVFDDVLLVDVDREVDAPVVRWRYLTDAGCASSNNNFSLPYGLAPICCPAHARGIRRGAEFTFTISDGRSRQLYGLVKQVGLPTKPEETTVVCILGPRPLYVWFTWILRLVHARLLHDPTKATTVALLNAIRATDGPGALTFTDSFVGDFKTYTFPQHPLGAFGSRSLEPHVLNYRSLTTKLQTPAALLLLVSLLLLEQRVLLVHDEPEVLSGLSQLLLRLLAPFSWKHLLIPVLPPELLHYANAPIPYLLGVPPDEYAELAPKLSNVVAFQLNTGTVQFRRLTADLPTLCDELPLAPATSEVPFSRLASPTTRDTTSALGSFRNDFQHSFTKDPETLEACMNALLFHVFADATQFLRQTPNGYGVDVGAFVAARQATDPPLLLRFVTAVATTPMMANYCADRLQSRGESFHGPFVACTKTKDLSYPSLHRSLQRRGTRAQEYPQVTQLVAGMWNQSERFHVSLADVRPLLDATYHMDHCGIVIDMLWERLGDSNDSTVATALQILVYLMLDGCEIVTEYLRFKESQRNHCRILKRHAFRGIVHGATQLLDFMNSPERLFTIRRSNSTQQWLAKVTFPRQELRPRYALPAFVELHHTIGRFHQPVHSVDLLNLDFDAKKPAAANNDPFDTAMAHPSHWR